MHERVFVGLIDERVQNMLSTAVRIPLLEEVTQWASTVRTVARLQQQASSGGTDEQRVLRLASQELLNMWRPVTHCRTALAFRQQLHTLFLLRQMHPALIHLPIELMLEIASHLWAQCYGSRYRIGSENRLYFSRVVELDVD